MSMSNTEFGTCNTTLLKIAIIGWSLDTIYGTIILLITTELGCRDFDVNILVRFGKGQ